MALLLGGLAAIAAWSVLKTGIAADDIWRFNGGTKLGGYVSSMVGKGFAVLLATISWALGFSVDPFLILKGAFG